MDSFKNIHIGGFIEKRVSEDRIEMSRICNFLKCNEDEVKKMYRSESLNSLVLLKWSKLLEYDFFRIYSHHLILYAPATRAKRNIRTSLPQFRKNVYTVEIIDFMLELMRTGKKTAVEIQNDYHIPKTTLYKWIGKYKK
ncbi:hypothetical protein [Chryseobacterium sp. JM1]|uniref:hypothetical protein n=1 Tax=Chryseobacterium sp. JM1 TaxID=1233950 RepID=UPI0004E744D8|nr:hypothetical protein [Chryseobacterium sp. JM1]KFF15756.1 transposase [Chryseobacterium sp. JM1]